MILKIAKKWPWKKDTGLSTIVRNVRRKMCSRRYLGDLVFKWIILHNFTSKEQYLNAENTFLRYATRHYIFVTKSHF